MPAPQVRAHCRLNQRVKPLFQRIIGRPLPGEPHTERNDRNWGAKLPSSPRQVHRNRYSHRVIKLCESDPELLPSIMPLLSARDTLREQLRKLDVAVARRARNDPICTLFMAIPGVGPLTSLAFKATIDDPSRFAKSKSVPAHLGLKPKVYQSGEIDRSGRISKSGDRLLRYLLAEAATSMLLRSSKWCGLKAWGVKLAKRIGMSKAIIAVARKLAIIMHVMWMTGEEFRFGMAEPVPDTP